jgi:hypothetical protein
MTDFDPEKSEPNEIDSESARYVDRAHLDRIYQLAHYKLEAVKGDIGLWIRSAADQRASRRATISGLAMAGLGVLGAFVNAVVPWLHFSSAVAVALIFAGTALIATAVITEAMLRMKLLGSAQQARETTTEALEQMRKARDSF